MKSLITDGLGTDGLVWLKLPPPRANSGQALKWCKAKIDSLLNRGPHVFKIGITSNPLFRFYKEPSHMCPSPGYYRCGDKFKGMHVLFAGSTFEEAALMEAALKDVYQGRPGNRNMRAGGEGRNSETGPFFTYLVFKLAM